MKHQTNEISLNFRSFINNMLYEEVIGSQRYLKKEMIGNGGFARCYLMQSSKSGQKFAGKVIRRRELRDKGARAKVMQEVDIHRSTNHHQIVRFIEVFDFDGEMYIILELCQNNSLKEFMKNRVRITEFQAKYYLLQLIDGLQYLHMEGIIHRDMKLGNVFLNNKMEVKIGDFGLSTRLNHPRERRYTTCGTPNYIAPEILAQTGHSCQVDVWALGIILYAFLFGKPPFESQTVDETYQRIKQCQFDFPKQIPISSAAKNLIKVLLNADPTQRITLSQIKGHQFITNSKLPPQMPSYTISIPPQNSFLKQWTGEQNIKLSVFPRKVSQMGLESSCAGGRLGKEKLERVHSCDKNMFKMSIDGRSSRDTSQLNRGVIFNSKMKINLREDICFPKKMPKSQNKYEEDANEIICYYDVSSKYGIGYLLSNGNYGVALNDQTSITETPTNLLYFDGTKLNQCHQSAPHLKKKVEILKLCKQKMYEYRQKNVLIPFNSEVYVKKFVKSKDFLVLKLSNGVFQFFWSGDSVTLRGYRWVRWRIGRIEGQGPLNGSQYPVHIQVRIARVRQFLQKESQKSKRKRVQKQ